MSRPVRETGPLGPDAFLAEAEAGEPFVLRGQARDWPLVSAGREGPPALARHLAPHLTEVPVQILAAPPDRDGFFSYTDDARGFAFERRQGTVGQLLDRLTGAPSGDTLYAGGINVPRVLPSLEAQLPMPIVPHAERLTSLWLGGRTRIPAHYDLPQNVAVCAGGRRRFTLFPTDQVRNLYLGPLERTIAGQPSSLVDPAAPDLRRFPRYAEALDNAQVAELAPGDALYVPALWFHAVESLEGFGCLVNFWWRAGPPHLVTPMMTLMHAQLTLRGMPARERAAWRVLFDEYAFGEPDLRHLPEDARGAAGESTPERRQWIKRMLMAALGR